ncbi:MAG: bifunctional heptose 7-phosphate kinase/heptose 1-phosphate adenyltransferase [Phycisphaerales bacterium]|nr:bifunctional heptose 7-phosphate kinase/heptose 1-phosphate adenyltransferase [Phycisphaerales bacterium]
MSSILERLNESRTPSIVVIGDLMLDEIVYGDAERLSPDSPVPVLEVRSVQARPGGAGNVVKCIKELGAIVHCIGVVGKDKEGELLKQLLVECGISIDHIIECTSRPTTVKRSIVGLAQHRHPQKMFRLDHESREELTSAQVDQLLSSLNTLLPSTDVVCIEDYGKGVLSELSCKRIIEHCKDAEVEVLVDPTGIEDYSRYSGATAITPNRSEAEKVTGKRIDENKPVEGAEELATIMCDLVQVHATIITIDKHGAILQERGKLPKHFPTRARSVYDVTGAGDVVLAAIAVGRGVGLSWGECVELANVAAGLEVEIFGATPIPMSKVKKELLTMQSEACGKIRSIEELAIEIKAAKDSGQRIVLTNGCFDVIHAGHVAYLREASELGDLLVVGVNTDNQVGLQKGAGRPIYELTERMEILAELQCVTLVTSFEEATAKELIRVVLPDVYVKGGDYEPQEINEYDLIQKLGITLQVLSERPGRSSSEVVEQLKSAK